MLEDHVKMAEINATTLIKVASLDPINDVASVEWPRHPIEYKTESRFHEWELHSRGFNN